MKKILAFMIALVMVFIITPLIVFAQDAVAEPAAAAGVLDFLKNSWAEVLFAFLAFVKVIVNLTPTEKDNAIFAWLDKIIGWIIPNRKAGGGTFG
jgi:uncharacterized membrane protein YccC